MKKIYFLLLTLLFISCTKSSSVVIDICGEKPNNIDEIDVTNNPNFVFEKDENFEPIYLIDETNNIILVNSYLECKNYVDGGWDILNSELESSENINNIYFYYLYLIFIFILSYFYFNDLKNRNLSRKNIANYFPLIFSFYVIFIIVNKLYLRGLYFPIFNNEMLLKFGYLFLAFLFYFYLSTLINEILLLNSHSLAITYFFCSYFIFDYIFIYFSKNFSFSFIFSLVTGLWLLLFLLKSNYKKNIIKLISSYLLILFYNRSFINFFSDLSNYKIKNDDVILQWFPLAKLLYENNLFYAIENNFVQGYGFFLTYVQVLIHKINFASETYFFSTIDSNILIVLLVFILMDLRLSKINKILLFISLMGIVLDDGWLRFLVFDSLMLEGIVSFVFASFILNFSKQMSLENLTSKKYFYFLFLSTLIFSKQFVETLVLIFVIILFIFTNFRKYSLIGILIFALSLINNNFLFKLDRNIEYLDISLITLFKEILYLKNPAWENIYYIVNKLMDPPLILFILCFAFVLFLINVFYSKYIAIENLLLFIFNFLNVFMVFILYLFIWKDTQLDSSFRYINNLIFVYFISFFYEMEKLQSPK